MSTKEKYYNRILIIDDDYISNTITEIMLLDTNLADEVVVFSSAREALSYIESACINDQAAGEDCPDLILLDIHMPQMDGYDFLDAFKHITQAHQVQAVIIVLSNVNDAREKARLQAYQVHSFLTKPITEEKLSKIVAHQEPCS